MDKGAWVVGVHKSEKHTFHKYETPSIKLIAGLGVEGDAHMGKYVKHRSRIARNPKTYNLRQVHLIHSELFDELKPKGFEVHPGQMGENITTRGIDLLGLPYGTILEIGSEAKIMITGLRNPCNQINGIKAGLMQAVLDRGEDGQLIRKSGVMAIVMEGGTIVPNDTISVTYPQKPYLNLEPV